MTDQATTLRALALELRATADRILAAVPAEAPAPTAEPTYLPMVAFAVRRGVSKSTVRRWIGQGMPVNKMGNIVRIKVRDADAWLEQHGGST